MVNIENSEDQGHAIVVFEVCKNKDLIKQVCLLDQYSMEQSFYSVGIKKGNEFIHGKISQASIYFHKVYAEHNAGSYKFHQDVHDSHFKEILPNCIIYKIITDEDSQTINGFRCGRSFDSLGSSDPIHAITEPYFQITHEEALADIDKSKKACEVAMGDPVAGFLERLKIYRSPDARSI